MSDDRGSMLPLILGFFLVGLLVVAGSIAAGDAFVQQRGLQDVCDGAAAAAAADAVEVGRGGGLAREGALRFGDVRPVIDAYLARDPDRRGVRWAPELSDDARTLTVHCAQTERIAFGALFGQGDGVEHRVSSTVRAALS